MVNPNAYARRWASLTPAQRKAEKIQSLKSLQARRERAMADPINADAGSAWWAQMTRLHLQDAAKINQLEGRSGFDYGDS